MKKVKLSKVCWCGHVARSRAGMVVHQTTAGH